MTDRPWRTLLLLAALLVLLVLFPDTVRSPRLAAGRTYPVPAVRPYEKPSKPQNQVAQRPSGAVATIIQAGPMRLEGPPKDPNRPEGLLRPVPN